MPGRWLPPRTSLIAALRDFARIPIGESLCLGHPSMRSSSRYPATGPVSALSSAHAAVTRQLLWGCYALLMAKKDADGPPLRARGFILSRNRRQREWREIVNYRSNLENRPWGTKANFLSNSFGKSPILTLRMAIATHLHCFTSICFLNFHCPSFPASNSFRETL